MANLIVVMPAAADDDEEEPVTAQANGMVIESIRFKGNDKTKPVTMLREMQLEIGDAPTQETLEKAAQAVMDLKLFESVSADMQGNDLLVTVEEKWYILPIPRLSANISGDTSYGLSVKWYNFRGLDDTLDFAVYQSESADDDNGGSLTYRLRYDIPYIFNSDTDVDVGIRHRERIDEDAEVGDYLVKSDSAEIEMDRWWERYGPRHGWRHGFGLHWENQSFDREVPNREEGQATSISGQIEFENTQFNLYSDSGLRFRYRIRTDLAFLDNDYNFTRQNLSVNWQNPGKFKHHTFEASAQIGFASGGRLNENAYSIGGDSTLRGFPSKDGLDGDAYYAARVQYFAPAFGEPAVRVFVFLDVADVFEDIQNLHTSNFQASAGFGIRWRITSIVDTEIEIGVGIPFTGEQPEAFGGKV